MLMADGGCQDLQIQQVVGQIDDKLVVYHSYLQSEKQRKESTMDDEAKDEAARKQLDAELNRKQKRHAQVKEQAKQFARKAKELDAETVALKTRIADGVKTAGH